MVDRRIGLPLRGDPFPMLVHGGLQRHAWGGRARALNGWRARPWHDAAASRDEGFRCRRVVVERAMGAHAVVVLPPGLDQDLGLGRSKFRR